MNGSNRFVVTLTDGLNYSCLLFSRETSAKLHRISKAFSFDSKTRYRINRRALRNQVAELLRSDEGNDSLQRLSDFLTVSPHNRTFAVCGGDIAGSGLFLRTQLILCNLNREDVPAGTEGKLSLLAGYDFSSFGTVVRKTGQAVRTRRKCRYCGRTYPATSFNSKAHTISEALGNKTLYTNDECDRCNATFCNGIEAQFINRLTPFFPVLDIAGKNGGRKVTGKNFAFYRHEKKEKRLPLVLNFSALSVSVHGGTSVTDIELRTWNPSRAWAPQNIYRFLCKFVIGILDTRLLRYFRRTIQWINGANFRQELPKVCIEYLPGTVRQPVIYTYRRLDNKNLRPYLFARVHLLTCAYTFVIPFCSLDKDGLNRDGFLRQVTGLVPSVRTQWLDLNRRGKIVPEVIACFVSGDHNIICRNDGPTAARWYSDTPPENPDSQEEMIYNPALVGRTAI